MAGKPKPVTVVARKKYANTRPKAGVVRKSPLAKGELRNVSRRKSR